MKCAAARTEEDARDITFLAEHLQLTRVEDVLALVLRFYPEERLPVRARLLTEGALLVNAVECLTQARALGDDYQLAYLSRA